MKTIRQQMIALLDETEMSARELSQVLGIREKDIYGHLEHISRSLKSKGKKVFIQPSVCLACGFVFEDRKRFTRPGRCPKCKKTRLQWPTYRVLEK
jgi:predicted Zn-ribbon and HTH transcriptional regulator